MTVSKKETRKERKAQREKKDAEFVSAAKTRLAKVARLMQDLVNEVETLDADGYCVKISFARSQFVTASVSHVLPSGLWHRFI